MERSTALELLTAHKGVLAERFDRNSSRMSSETPSPSPERDPTLCLRDMVEFCDRVIACTAGFNATRHCAILR